MKKALWHLHPAANNDLTLGDRVADRLRNTLASWPFIIGSLAYMGLWIFIAKLRLVPIDNPQLTYLNLILSCAAALASSVILLSQKRSDVIASEVALHTKDNTDELMTVNRQQLEILTKLNGLDGKIAGLAEVVQQVLAARGEQGSAVLAEAKAARSAAESAFVATQALAAVATGPQPALPDAPAVPVSSKGAKVPPKPGAKM